LFVYCRGDGVSGAVEDDFEVHCTFVDIGRRRIKDRKR